MTVFNYDINGMLLGSSLADKSPLEKDVYLIPAFATTKEPLPIKEGFNIFFVKDEWTYVEIPVEVIKKEEEIILEEAKNITIEEITTNNEL